MDEKTKKRLSNAKKILKEYGMGNIDMQRATINHRDGSTFFSNPKF